MSRPAPKIDVLAAFMLGVVQTLDVFGLLRGAYRVSKKPASERNVRNLEGDWKLVGESMHVSVGDFEKRKALK